MKLASFSGANRDASEGHKEGPRIRMTMLLLKKTQATAIILLAVASALPAVGQSTYEPYTVGTFAGIPAREGADDRTGAPPYFLGPGGVAADAEGNLYVADSYHHTIRKIFQNGAITTLAGAQDEEGSADGERIVARFRHPAGVALDGSGNLYVADSLNHTIRKITPGGNVTTFAGASGISGSADGTGNAARFNQPFGVAVSSAGDIYVSEWGNHTIRKITPEGVVTTVAGLAGVPGSTDGPGSAARFYYPSQLAVNQGGEIYVADSENFTVRKIDPTDVVSTFAGSARMGGTTDGTGAAARFAFPNGLAFDGAGNLYVADSYNHTVRRITAEAVVSTVAGLAETSGFMDGIGSAARFNYPLFLATSSGGNTIFVADSQNSTVRQVTTANAVVSTVVNPRGTFHNPTGAAMDAAENLYIADLYNHTVRKITPQGVVTTLAGLAGVSGSADGTGSAARFYFPSGIAADEDGNLYVADYNTGLRKITPDGVVTTLTDGFSPRGLATDSAGNVYGALGCAVARRSKDGVRTILAGQLNQCGCADGSGSDALFLNPTGFAVDSEGTVYVADQDAHAIRKITSEGVVTTLAGLCGVSGTSDGTGSAARFTRPTAVALDEAGNLYVAEENRLRKVTPQATVTSLAGGLETIGSRDGRGSAASFYRPGGIAVRSSGALYVADTENHTIRLAQPFTAVSRKMHAGTVFDLDLPLFGAAAIEPRGSSPAGSYQIVLTCYRAVTFKNATVTLGTGTVSGTSGNGSSTLVVDVSGVTSGQRLGVMLSGVDDTTITRDLTIPIDVLVGDTTQNGSVSASDVGQTKAEVGQPVTAANFLEDVNANHFINASDVSFLKSQVGMSLSPIPKP